MSTFSNLKIRTAVLVAALSVGFVSPALHAQMPAAQSRVIVPFEFEVGSTHFAPGTYTLSNPQEVILAVQGAKRSALVMSSHEINAAPSRTSKVVFDRIGDQYFLREVWREGKVEYLVCPESKDEHTIKQMERNSDHAAVANPTSVEIAMVESPR
jgi:hypothetical protein